MLRVLCALVVCSFAVCAAADEPWQDLFDGRSLDGWVVSGDASAWDVRDGEIVVTGKVHGGWLRTDRTFRDFELTLEFWMPEGGNSGLGLRGSSAGDPAFTGFEIQMLDTSGEEPGLRNCGAVYEAIAPDVMAVFPAGSWNTYRVRLVGDTLDVWLNDRRIHDGERLDERGIFRDPSQPLPLNTRATTGYIALQDHGHPFRFRNIRIKDLSPDPEPPGMVALITPDLSGWFADHDATWTYEDGALVGRGGPGHFFTNKTYADFELRGLVKVNERGNSGIYIRAKPHSDPNNPWPIEQGYEAQVDQHDPKNFTGCLYNVCWPENVGGPITRDDAWFDYRIVARGDRIRTWVNGVPMVDCERDGAEDGHFAVQGHHEGNVIMYKDLRVLELD